MTTEKGVVSKGEAEILPHFHFQLGQPDQVYIYRNEDGEPIAAIYRFETSSGKTIRPYDITAKAWSMPSLRLIYNLEYLAKQKESSVLLVEGEKCADALLKLGYLAVSAMGGANAARMVDWKPLEGRDVIVWPDADEAGLKYADDALTQLLEIGAKSVSILDIKSEKPKGWDAADAIQEGWNKTELDHYIHSGKLRTKTQVPANDNPVSLEWNKPDKSFLDNEVKPPEFPLNIFPDELAEWVHSTAKVKSSPIDYVAASLLTASASLIGAARRISPWQGWEETPVLWSALIGSPSSGKSPAMDPVLSVMRDIEKEYSEEHQQAIREYEAKKMEAELSKANWQAQAKEKFGQGYNAPFMPEAAQLPDEPQMRRLIIKDATIEATAQALKASPKGIMIHRDELAGWFAGFDRYSGSKGNDRAFWLEAFGARSYTVDRVGNKGQPMVIDYLTTSIMGSIQPDKLTSCLMKGDDDGLSARFLYFYPDQVERRRPRFTPDNHCIERILRKLAKLDFHQTDEKRIPKVIELNDEAADYFDEWWQMLPKKEPQGRLSGWWGKLQGYALRIALVLHYLEWACSDNDHDLYYVGLQHIKAAIEFVDNYLVPMAEKVHGLSHSKTVHPNTIRLANYIMDAQLEEFTIRDLQRTSVLRGCNSDEVKDTVFELVRFDWVRAAPIRAGDSFGKAKSRYIVNSSL